MAMTVVGISGCPKSRAWVPIYITVNWVGAKEPAVSLCPSSGGAKELLGPGVAAPGVFEPKGSNVGFEESLRGTSRAQWAQANGSFVCEHRFMCAMC